MRNSLGTPHRYDLSDILTPGRHQLVLRIDNQVKDIDPGENNIESVMPLSSDIRLWNEFSPNVYSLKVSLVDKAAKTTDIRTEPFGMREIKAQNGRLTVNSHPAFMRGTLDCAAFPKTGFPPTDKASWRKVFAACKAHGKNHVRYHSWCPPEAAFAAADEMGMYLEVECSGWVNTTVTLGDGLPIDKYIMDESEAMVKAYGNHPSFCMMMYGNEPAGNKQSDYLTRFVSHWKSRDSRRIYSSAGGWPNLPVSDFLSDLLALLMLSGKRKDMSLQKNTVSSVALQFLWYACQNLSTQPTIF